jgi:hypothetical protein
MAANPEVVDTTKPEAIVPDTGRWVHFEISITDDKGELVTKFQANAYQLFYIPKLWKYWEDNGNDEILETVKLLANGR